MSKRKIIRLSAIIAAVVCLFITVSLSIQYFSARQIQSHSKYTVGTITKLYIRDDKTLTKTGVDHLYHYQVQYTFSPDSNAAQYHSDQGVSKADYENLRVGGPVNIYYYTQKPSVQSIAGYQSSPEQLGILSVVTGLVFLCLVFIAIKLKNPRVDTVPINQPSNSALLDTRTTPSNVPTGLAANTSLSAPIWFSYPQTGSLVNLNRHILQGTLSIAGNQLTVASETNGQIISSQVSDMKSVKGWAPTMTFYFNDGSKFQIDFHDARQNKWALLGIFGSLFSLGGKNYKEALINMKPFEDYFARQNLLR